MIKQTAVEWFLIRRDVLEIQVRLGKLSPIEYAEELTKLERQAKKMEKVQHRITWGNALSAINVDKWDSFEDFYNETYGGNK